MLYLESLVENVLSTEGQILLGLDFVTDILKLDMKKMENIFSMCIKQYARRRPIEVTKDFVGGAPIQMPSSTLGIKSIRWGILPDYPRFFQDSWEEITWEYDMASKKLKVFPPNTAVKVTYLATPTITNIDRITEVFHSVEDEQVFEDKMSNTYKQGTLSISKGSLTLEEISRNTPSNPDKIILSGTLGSGIIDMKTREFSLELNNTDEGDVIFSYYSKYKYCVELDEGDYIFYKFFALNILRSIASLRSQYTQTELENIDLTTESLQERVLNLEREVVALMKSTISFSGISQI